MIQCDHQLSGNPSRFNVENFQKILEWQGFVAQIAQREILLVAECQLEFHLFHAAKAIRD